MSVFMSDILCHCPVFGISLCLVSRTLVYLPPFVPLSLFSLHAFPILSSGLLPRLPSRLPSLPPSLSARVVYLAWEARKVL